MISPSFLSPHSLSLILKAQNKNTSVKPSSESPQNVVPTTSGENNVPAPTPVSTGVGVGLPTKDIDGINSVSICTENVHLHL